MWPLLVMERKISMLKAKIFTAEVPCNEVIYIKRKRNRTDSIFYANDTVASVIVPDGTDYTLRGTGEYRFRLSENGEPCDASSVIEKLTDAKIKKTW